LWDEGSPSEAGPRHDLPGRRVCQAIGSEFCKKEFEPTLADKKRPHS
jgi:hypothetical protein